MSSRGQFSTQSNTPSLSMHVYPHALTLTSTTLSALHPQESVPPTLLSFEPCQGELGPLAICTAAVTVTGSCEGPQRLLVRVSSSSVPCSTCARHATGDGARAVAAAEDGSGVSAAGQVCSCSVEYVQVLVLVSSPKVALSKYR